MLKVFVATNETQGQRSNDFCFVPEGELVYFGTFECSNEPVDGSCGCKRSLCGIREGTGTTTMRVVQWENSALALAREIYRAFERGGWVEVWGKSEMRRQADEATQRILRDAADLPVGAVVERRGAIVPGTSTPYR